MARLGYATRRPYVRKRRTYAKKHTLKAVEKKVNRLAKVMTPELKISDSTIDKTGISWPDITNPNQYLVVRIPDPALTSGTEYDNKRIGDKIRIRKLYIKGTAELGAYGDPYIMRLILVRWKDTTALGISNILADISQNGSVNSPYNTLYDQQFSVLSDRCITLLPESTSLAQFSYVKNNCNWEVNYVANGTTVADGQIVLYVFSNYPTASGTFTAPPYVHMSIRSQYSDL